MKVVQGDNNGDSSEKKKAPPLLPIVDEERKDVSKLDVSFEADWQFIKERKQKRILQNNKKENATRKPYVYEVGQKVLVQQDPNRKHDSDKCVGPFEIVETFDNGTVKLQQGTTRGGVVYQTWNVRNITPYKA